jgi:hypothetical protein
MKGSFVEHKAQLPMFEIYGLVIKITGCKTVCVKWSDLGDRIKDLDIKYK